MRITTRSIDSPYVLLLCMVIITATGCQTARQLTISSVPVGEPRPTTNRSLQVSDNPRIKPVGHTEDAGQAADVGTMMPTPATDASSVQYAYEWGGNAEHLADDLFLSIDFLDATILAILVEQRNPSLQAMYASWQAAAARYPQDIALDDPMLDFMMAPASFAGNSNVQSSWTLQGSQKLPWKGKRQARGLIASQNAQAAALDVEDTRLQLTLASRLAFADYLLAQRTRELNSTEIKLLAELKSIALTRYENNQTPQQDVLQAEVDLAEAQRRGVEAARAHRVAMARINTLLQRPPRTHLPPPSEINSASESLPDDDDLLARALQLRPDLSARAARIAAEQAAYCLALREFYPDVEIYGRFDRFWVDREQQGSVGLKLNLPIQRNRRRAAVEEALAKIARTRAEYEADVARIGFEVQAASARVQESRRIIELYSAQILLSAEQNVASARAGYEAGSVNFLTLVSAQRQLIDSRQRLNEALAESQRQLAELERAVGTPLSDKFLSAP